MLTHLTLTHPTRTDEEERKYNRPIYPSEALIFQYTEPKRGAMSKSLDEIIKKASEAYPDEFLVHQFLDMEKSGDKTQSFRNVLASFLMQQMRELYDPNSSDEQNIWRLMSGLGHARDDIEAVMTRLEKLLE